MNRRRGLWFLAVITVNLLLLAGHFTGCQPEDWILDLDCNDCYGYRPDSANLIVYLTINEENDSVPLIFYKGDSGGELEWKDTATSQEFYLFAEIGTTYTVRAEYQSGPNTVIAFDSDEMQLSDYGADCGDPCYIVKGGIFDIRLK